MTREDWLQQLTNALRPHFLEVGCPLPENVRVTCGWPSRSARPSKKQRIGECWSSSCSDDEHFEIFISPSLASVQDVGGTLVHELVHAAVGTEHGHKAPFKRAATAVGLEGKMTCTTCSKELADRLEDLAAFAIYPHAKLNAQGGKKQSTRMIKMECPLCGYVARTTRKWLEVGVPTCCCGTEMEVEF